MPTERTLPRCARAHKIDCGQAHQYSEKTATTRKEQMLFYSTALVLELYKSGAALILMVLVGLGFTLV